MGKAGCAATTEVSLERPFLDKRLALRLSSRAWEFPFADFATELARSQGGVIEARLGALGMDEIYWDIRLGEHLLTLHSQHSLGVFLCAASGQSERLLEDLVPFARRYVARRRSLWTRIRSGLRTIRHLVPRPPPRKPHG